MKKVSILVPVYNTEKWLSRCLDSLICQSWPELEIVCINDGSTDRSLQVLQKYMEKDERIHLYNYENSGISATRNRALHHATGDCLLFVDSDDYIDKAMVKTMVEYMEAEDCDIVQCGFVMDFGPIPYFRKGSHRRIYGQSEAIQALVSEDGINNYPWGKLYRKEVFENVRFPENVKGFEDTRTIFRTFLNAGKIGTIPDRFVHYVQRSGSLTNKMSLQTVYDMRRAYQMQEKLLKKQLPEAHFSYARSYYNTDMVLIYTLIVFCHKKDHPEFEPGHFDWHELNPLYKAAYGAWLAIACAKFGWNMHDIDWK